MKHIPRVIALSFTTLLTGSLLASPAAASSASGSVYFENGCYVTYSQSESGSAAQGTYSARVELDDGPGCYATQAKLTYQKTDGKWYIASSDSDVGSDKTVVRSQKYSGAIDASRGHYLSNRYTGGSFETKYVNF